MNQRAIIGCTILLGLWSTSAVAQGTLGELLDAGGKKLTKEGVVAMLSGNTVTGPTKGGGQREYTYKADGTFSGFLQSQQGRGQAVVGTWTVDDSGKACFEFRLRGQMDQVCAFLFVNSEQYYASDSDSDRSSPILKRTIKK